MQRHGLVSRSTPSVPSHARWTPLRRFAGLLVALLVAAVSLVPAGSAAAAGSAPLQLAFDAWQPNTGACQQVVTFRLLPVASQTPPTGVVVLMSDTGVEIGRVDVTGFGTHSVQGACATDDLHHRVSLHYSGDETYAGQVAASPDVCSRAIVTDPATTRFFSGGAPFFLCRTNYSHSPRLLDGRLTTGFMTFGTLGGDVEYGLSAGMSYLLNDLDEHGAAPTALVQHVVDGVVVATVSPEEAENSSIEVSTSTLSMGVHSAGVSYPGDPRWAPAGSVHEFRVVKSRPSGDLGVRKWRLKRGERARMWFTLRNAFDKAAVGPTGRVDLYVGSRKVKTVKVMRARWGRVKVVLPPLTRAGTYRLRVVYRGDSRYLKLDSSSKHWYGHGHYVQVS